MYKQMVRKGNVVADRRGPTHRFGRNSTFILTMKGTIHVRLQLSMEPDTLKTYIPVYSKSLDKGLSTREPIYGKDPFHM